MVNNQPVQLDSVFHALADPTRRAIIERLMLGDVGVNELATPFPVSLPAISKHLRVLENAGLIVRRPLGRQRICSLSPEGLESAAKWLEQYQKFWTEQLDSLETYLHNQAKEKA